MSVISNYDADQHDIDGLLIMHKSGDYKMPKMHYHNAYEFGFLESGKRSYMIKDELIHLKPHDAYLVDKNTIHRSIGGNFVITMVEFTEEYLRNFFSEYSIESITECFKNAVLHIKESDFEELISLVYRLEKDENDFLALSQIIDILKTNLSRKNYDPKSADDRIAFIIDYISENYKRIDSLDTIADKFYISKSYLCRLFKGNSNISIMKYINTLKVNLSIEFLSDKSLTMAEVAEKSGFGSLSHFSKTFNSIMGMSPSAYRKSSVGNKGSNR